MDTSSESVTGKLQRAKKTRICADGRTKCPKNTYLRFSEKQQAYVYYAKVKVRGVEDEPNTGILESDPGSREAATRFVAEYSRKMLDAQYERSEALIRESNASDTPVVGFPSKRSMVYVAHLEKKRYDRINGEDSPAYVTVVKRLNRLCEHFGHERDVSTITRSDIHKYITERRSTKHRGGTVTWGTIRRELALLKAGVREANEEGIFVPPLVLPINSRELTLLVKQDPVNEKQRSHQYTEEDCEAWVAAAKGTRLEHIVYVAWKTGMRSAELQALCWAWIYPEAPGKGYAARIILPEYLYKITKLDPRPIALNDATYQYLKRLAVGKGPKEPLLGTIQNATDLAAALGRKAGRSFESVGVNDLVSYRSPYMTLRDLRASAGRRVFNRKGLFHAMHFLRHKDVKTTTDHYVRSSSKELAEIAEAMD